MGFSIKISGKEVNHSPTQQNGIRLGIYSMQKILLSRSVHTFYMQPRLAKHRTHFQKLLPLSRHHLLWPLFSRAPLFPTQCKIDISPNFKLYNVAISSPYNVPLYQCTQCCWLMKWIGLGPNLMGSSRKDGLGILWICQTSCTIIQNFME